ncbi:BREX-3 system phosphatase PglZ [Pseudomonas aeruginosa]|uniref:BREX-3 system phosphatase PglZ n=1 Tax=Pseudomonas aeruginosa TaxID=287 RepID=UPI000F61F55D|nr:BREX-3 system phosphatase PglZ [Pseudomonas aeruginosa]RRH85397.1 BREX-3 system phosphatase PglZ [Pseudomonas aeruginosa]HCW1033962.1 BREX-3 system phosphatase PglZ [Pseudomonas aeruginosa]HCW1045655.1 BREX-3 system phosphatase PglZ [Pseudomonas aeruginosa]HDY5503661.1 BREX-3 system phosphatase PglZ [Pseudomonas aeruginosa]
MTYSSVGNVANRSTLLADRILKEFPSDLARLWIVADPDNVLLDEQVLAGLRERGFDVLPFEDSIAFRAEYEERYHASWAAEEPYAPKALVIQVRDSSIADLPWDYLRQGRKVSLSLAELFPKLSYTVLRQLGSEILPSLFEAQTRHATQAMGEAATKEFVLTHIYRVSPHLITRPEDLWRELLRLHYRETLLPRALAEHIHQVLADRPVFASCPVAELFSNRSFALRVVQDAWYRYLSKLGLTGLRTAEPEAPDYIPQLDIAFEYHDIRVIVDSMFLDGTLHPLAIQGVPVSLPEWAKAGVVQDPAAMRNLVLEGLKSLSEELPGATSPYRDWTHFARRLGEVISRFHGLDAARAEGLKSNMQDLVARADSELQEWVQAHYADLPSLPAAKGPVMVHQVPRYLALRRSSGEDKIALVVFDGLAVDQWTQIRENLVQHAPRLMFDENACFAWLPTLTSISRQALFSGLRPREFAEYIDTTSKEPQHWIRFWQDQGLRTNEILYRKAIKRTDELPELQELLSNPGLKVAGLVVDTVDEIIHGAVLGKRGVAAQINSWCESGFVDRLFAMLLDQGFHIYLTADHGNAEALGIGRPNQGVATELRGERVRTYRSETMIAETAATIPDSFRLDIAGLPANFMPLFAGGRGAFVPKGDQVVVHGGMSLEELIVPFVKVSYVN